MKLRKVKLTKRIEPSGTWYYVYVDDWPHAVKKDEATALKEYQTIVDHVKWAKGNQCEEVIKEETI